LSKPLDGRDPRLDFFRGLALLIIFVAHVPGNPLTAYIPAKFGWSDAADMFVFMSGCAAAIAFGGTFLRAGWWIGTARIAFRCWQLYFSHCTLFFVVLAVTVASNRWMGTGIDYLDELNLDQFLRHPADGSLRLFLLTYVPNYFDILPVYLVVLAMVPAAMLLAQVRPWLPMAASVTLWAWNLVFPIFLPADLELPDRPWFLNPFGWQLVFFTGFSLARGWIEPPPPRRWLLWLCALFLVISALGAHPMFYLRDETVRAIGLALVKLSFKTDYGPVRYLHFLAGAYVVVCLLRGREEWLPRLFAPVMKVGQQGLATFLFGMVLARLAGLVLDITGRGAPAVVAVNAAGVGLHFACAYTVAWFKATPWKMPDRRSTALSRGTAPSPARG
jgi:hypothetical protein